MLKPLLTLFLCSAALAWAAPPGSHAKLAILETTDLHGNVLGYDYYKLAPDASIGLDRVATLIAQARKEFPNTLLLDNGDTIQGNALADYQAVVNPLPCGETLAIHKAMNYLGFEGGGVGNHEFNYGLAYLTQVSGHSQPPCGGPAFPIVLANVLDVRTGKPLFTPYKILEKRIQATDADGKAIEATIKIGIIGFTPPTISAWDRRWLEGKIRTRGIRETAEKYIPQMRAEGAELIVAISHGGLDDAPYSASMENANLYLAQVPGVDAMLLGHSHQVFPQADSRIAQFNLAGVDKAQGMVAGVPTVMASLWGKALGLIQLQLRNDGKRWSVHQAATKVEVRSTQMPDRSFVLPDPAIGALVAAEHEATMRYVKTPVGSTDFRMSTYFADVGDVSAIEVVNIAQAAYLRAYVKANLPQLAGLPVLSISAPFKGGAAGVRDYTDVPAGKLALNNAADLYLYPNSLYGVKISGAVLKSWLEKGAERFNTIDPKQVAPQELINLSHPSYNFDSITSADLHYEIDITEAPGKRIKALRYQDKPIQSDQEFLVATNNYRASGGGNFPGLDGSNVIYASPDPNREVLIDYIKAAKNITRATHGSARSWRFTATPTAGPILFRSAPGMLSLAHAAGLDNIEETTNSDAKGYAIYALKLAQ